MSAPAEILIRDLSARGVRLSCSGDNLRIVAPRGTLTSELRQTLIEAKPAIIAALACELRAKLESIALAEGVAVAIVRELPNADVEACAGLSGDVLSAYVRALRDSDLRARGIVPSDETAVGHCRHCGAVWLAPEVVAVAPVVDGWPRVIGCPWCHVENRSRIPRPTMPVRETNRRFVHDRRS